MKLNVSRLLKEAGAIEKFHFSISKLQDFDEAVFIKPIVVEGSISNTGETLQMRAKVDTEISAQCDRCLENVDIPLTFEFVENYRQNSAYEEDGLENNEFIVFEDDLIDLIEAIRENVILNLPMQILCNPECPGICPQCGQNLKEKQCDCRTEAVDPRLAVLAKLKGIED